MPDDTYLLVERVVILPLAVVVLVLMIVGVIV